jgi:hypothetical protein
MAYHQNPFFLKTIKPLKKLKNAAASALERVYHLPSGITNEAIIIWTGIPSFNHPGFRLPPE